MAVTVPDKWQRRFFTIWTGQIFSLIGSSLVQFALIWWLTEQTRSATVLAFAAFVGTLPQIVLGPLAGVWVDRYPRRRIMILADSTVAAITALLAISFATGVIQLWHVYVALFCRSAAGAFHFPAMAASTSLMVPEQHLQRVAGLNQALHGGVNILGPALGAVLIKVLPMGSVLAIDVVTALIAVVPLFFFEIPQPAKAIGHDGQREPFMTTFRSGLRYVRGWPGLLIVLGFAMFLNFMLSPINTLTPLMITNHFKGGAEHLAALEAGIGIGIIAGGLLLGIWGGFKRRMVTSQMGIIGVGSGVLLMGVVPSHLFPLAIAAYLLAGIMIAFANGPMMAAVQASVAPEMQGRIFTLMNSGATAMTPLGLLLSGPLADAVGVRPFYLLAGGACVICGFIGLVIPAVVNIDQEGYGSKHATIPALQAEQSGGGNAANTSC